MSAPRPSASEPAAAPAAVPDPAAVAAAAPAASVAPPSAAPLGRLAPAALHPAPAGAERAPGLSLPAPVPGASFASGAPLGAAAGSSDALPAGVIPCPAPGEVAWAGRDGAFEAPGGGAAGAEAAGRGVSAPPAAPRAATAPVLKVDLDAIRANWAQAKRLSAPGGLSAVLKADAYGLGLVPVARALAAAGCADFWVNDLDEAERLRAAVPAARIFCLMGLAGAPPAAFAALGAVPALVSPAEVEACARHAAASGRAMRVALQIDTGLGRLGLSEAETARLAAAPARLAGLELAALVSHLAAYNLPDDPGNAAQLARLARLARGLPPAPLSLSASSGLFLGPEWRRGLARAGSALFGTQTSVVHQPGLTPCYALEAPVIAVAEHPAGRRLGYRGAGELSRPSRIATLAAGYADGLPQLYAEAGRPRLAGRPAAVVGGVAMNLTMLDVTDLPEAETRPGARAVLLDAAAPVEPLAEALGCAPNVLLTQIGAAVRKDYLGA